MNQRGIGRALYCVGALLTVVAGPAVVGRACANAQTKPASKSAQETMVLVEQGIVQRRNGDDVGALATLKRAQSLGPASSRLLVHLAAVHQALGEWEAADHFLTRALADLDDPYIRRHEVALTDARRRVDIQIGSLEVRAGRRSS